MGKTGRISLAIVLAVVMSLSLLTAGAFAQSVAPSHTNQATQVLQPTTILQEANQTVQVSSTSSQLPHQWKEGVSWKIVCASGYRSVYRGRRWVCVR
jgi:Tfp pilus assembly protein PilE